MKQVKVLILVIGFIVVVGESSGQNVAAKKPYTLSVAPWDGYLDNLGPEEFTQIGKYYRGELTDMNMGANLRDYVGWRWLGDTLNLVIEIDFKAPFSVAQVQQTVHKASPPLVYWRVYLFDEFREWKLWVNQPRIEEPPQAMYRLYHCEFTYRKIGYRARIEMGINDMMYLYIAEIMVLQDIASPLPVTASSWDLLKRLMIDVEGLPR